MHTIEPFYLWRNIYIASEDENSPFFGRIYSEFKFTNTIYDHYIHPQWDEIGSETLYIKILFANYNVGYCIIEMFGEWNDAINNDIMYFKRNIIEPIEYNGINKFILIGENILNFHSSDESYYQEWFENLEDGWIVSLNFREHVIAEFENENIDYYIAFGGKFNVINWRSYLPDQLYEIVNGIIIKRLST